MTRFTTRVKLALGIASAFLVGNTANAQEYSDYFATAPCTTCGDAEATDGPYSLFKGDVLNIGGWFQGGYHSESNDLFNNQPDDFNLHQAWLYAEKVAESKDGRLGFGFRIDGMYGIDSGDTQSFGNNPGVFDNDDSFDRGGGYGWAIPQLYGEVAGENWSVKIGHFYTLIGYEVVTAPDNFFYSHAMTMFLSEPFTHTGAVGY